MGGHGLHVFAGIALTMFCDRVRSQDESGFDMEAIELMQSLEGKWKPIRATGTA